MMRILHGAFYAAHFTRRILSGALKNALYQEGRGAASLRLPLLPSGPGGVRRRVLARFLAQDS